MLSAQTFLFVFSIIVFPFSFFNFILAKTNVINLKPYVVVSGSMEPVIPTGSIIYSENKTQYKVGEVITFLRGKEIISHRIVGAVMLGRDIYYSTKGDANGVVDEELVNKNYVLGSVRSSYPTIGIVVMALKTPLGIILGTLLPLSIFMYLHIRPKSYSY